MDSSNKRSEKNKNTSQNTNYNPWNLIFSARNRTESENSVSSNPPSTPTGSPIGGLQRQTSKNEEYLWMMWRS